MSTLTPRLAVPTLHSLVDDAIAQMPTLAHYLSEAIHDELRDKPQYFAVQSAWRPLRARFVEEFKAIVLPLLRTARDGLDPLKPRSFGSLDSLSLVDEKQALRDVGIAHVVQAAEEANRMELLELNTCFAALKGTTRPHGGHNPLRPAVFAHALQQIFEKANTDGQGGYVLMQASAQPVAKGLAQLYGHLGKQLHDAELSEMITRNTVALRNSSADHQRLARARLEPTSHHASFDSLAPGVDGRPAPDLLSRLYKQILADTRLLSPVKNLLNRLQIAVVRMAKTDPMVLRDQEHVTWQLLNRVAAQGMAYERADDPNLQEFLAFMSAEVNALVEVPLPTTAMFEQSLARLDKQVGQSARQRSQRNAAVLAALEREEFRAEWLEVITEQIAEQISRSPAGPRLRAFLSQRWPEAIVQAMVLQGREAPDAQAAIELVDPLLDSLKPVPTEPERETLRQSLPGLVEGLRRGAALVATPEAELDGVLQELMVLHGRLLRGQTLPIETVPATPSHAMASRHSQSAPETTADERLRRLMDERPSQWAYAEVDRGELPTVPVQLYSGHATAEAEAAVNAWLEKLSVGTWYHLFVQGGWLTAQLTWIGETRQHHLFVGQDSEQRHSLTRGALERLLPNGLITALGEDSIVQRAVDTLVQNLGDA